jgi:lipopolysaccharide/colanic/teichoic acid biosynthesis glycosyltransferase
MERTMKHKAGFYEKYIKRAIDIICSGLGLIVLSPLFIVLIIVGSIKMKGNPFFLQERPGLDEKIFKMIKFRTMTNEKDENGELLPSNQRLVKYGRFLRKTSLDEIPELINIFKGDMSIIGPRPLLVKYLPLYNEEQHHRHDVRPGLTGYAQANGRNGITWEEKFELDVWYVENINFMTDVKVIIDTIRTVLHQDGINSTDGKIVKEFKGEKANVPFDNDASI